MTDYKQAYETLREAAEQMLVHWYTPNGVQPTKESAALRAALDAQVPSVEPSADNPIDRACSVFDHPEHEGAPTYAEMNEAGYVLAQQSRTEREAYAWMSRALEEARAELESVRRERDELRRSRTECDAQRVVIDDQYRNEVAALTDELESARRDRNELRKLFDAESTDHENTVNVLEERTRERDEWKSRALTAENTEARDITRLTRERDEAQAEVLHSDCTVRRAVEASKQAPRAQVFDPALTREQIRRALAACDEWFTQPDWTKETRANALAHLRLATLALRDSENRAAEPYGIAETEALLEAISSARSARVLEHLRDCVLNSRSKS